MREIRTEEITALVRQLCIEANHTLPKDIQQAFETGKEQEQSPLGQMIFDEMIRNCQLACTEQVPICCHFCRDWSGRACGRRCL